MEDGLAAELRRAREEFVKHRQTTDFLPGYGACEHRALWISGIADDDFFTSRGPYHRGVAGLCGNGTRQGKCSPTAVLGDATQGIALIDPLRTRFDVVLMNPPFGACCSPPRSNSRGAIPVPRTMSTPLLLSAASSSSSAWAAGCDHFEHRLLSVELSEVARGGSAQGGTAGGLCRPRYGVLDSALVEVAAYCLEKGREVAA